MSSWMLTTMTTTRGMTMGNRFRRYAGLLFLVLGCTAWAEETPREEPSKPPSAVPS